MLGTGGDSHVHPREESLLTGMRRASRWLREKSVLEIQHSDGGHPGGWFWGL